MKYYLNGRLKNSDAVRMWFKHIMQNISKDSPTLTTFLIKIGNDVFRRISIGPIANTDKIEAEIGYTIEKSYTGAGVMSKAVESAISFLKLLRKEYYDFTHLCATTKFIEYC